MGSSSDRTDDKGLVGTVSKALRDVKGLQMSVNDLYYPLNKCDKVRGAALNTTLTCLR